MLICSITALSIRTANDIHTKRMVQSFKNGRWDMALKESNQAESIFYRLDAVSNPVAWYRGTALFSQGRVDQALYEFKQALKVHPWHVHALNNIGVCYVKKNQLDVAADCFKQALDIDPGFHQAKLNLDALTVHL